jgi:hypothetical protein
MQEYMEKNLRANKPSLQIPKRIELALTKPKSGKSQPSDKDKLADEMLEKYVGPVHAKKAQIGPSDQQHLHKKLRAILSRKNITKQSSTQVSQVG